MAGPVVADDDIGCLDAGTAILLVESTAAATGRVRRYGPVGQRHVGVTAVPESTAVSKVGSSRIVVGAVAADDEVGQSDASGAVAVETAAAAVAAIVQNLDAGQIDDRSASVGAESAADVIYDSTAQRLITLNQYILTNHLAGVIEPAAVLAVGRVVGNSHIVKRHHAVAGSIAKSAAVILGRVPVDEHVGQFGPSVVGRLIEPTAFIASRVSDDIHFREPNDASTARIVEASAVVTVGEDRIVANARPDQVRVKLDDSTTGTVESAATTASRVGFENDIGQRDATGRIIEPTADQIARAGLRPSQVLANRIVRNRDRIARHDPIIAESAAVLGR